MAETIYYKSPSHKTRLLDAMQALGKVDGGVLDPEYASALYILTADAGIWNRARGYISNRGIAIEEMLKREDFSGGYEVLVKLAGNLFNGNEHIDPLEFLRLDESNFLLALSAIMIRRHGLRLEDLREEESKWTN